MQTKLNKKVERPWGFAPTPQRPWGAAPLPPQEPKPWGFAPNPTKGVTPLEPDWQTHFMRLRVQIWNRIEKPLVNRNTQFPFTSSLFCRDILFCSPQERMLLRKRVKGGSPCGGVGGKAPKVLALTPPAARSPCGSCAEPPPCPEYPPAPSRRRARSARRITPCARARASARS